MILDWSNIRPLNGGRDKGFEELCAQLARAESPTGARFERKGTPDAGVECYAVLSDGGEWAWQAKYFDALGNSQWSQIDESVKKTITKHPRLVRYFICTPLDRPDGRIDGQRSAKDKWDEHVVKWRKQAADKGMTVEFVYWGSHELLERLAKPEHVGRVCFWFDVRGFDSAWFTARLDEALRTAGPRYTPEVHVDLPIALELEAFGRTDRFFEHEKAQARTIREKLRALEYSEGADDVTIDASVGTLAAKVHSVLAGMGAISPKPLDPLPFKAIVDKICAAEQASEELSQLLFEHEREFEAKSEATDTRARWSYRSNPFRDRRIRLSRLTSELRTTRESLIHADAIAGSALMLLRGAAGTGKTHLLCDFARQRVSEGRPTVLLMGQQFVSQDTPWSQALQQLDLAGLSAQKFVGALEAAAQAAGSRALLVIDAINEGTGRTIWLNHLASFLTHLERSPWIGVLLAIRSSYEKIIVPEYVRKHAAVVTHQGFMEHEYDAMKMFCLHYGLEFPSTPLLVPEFRNPLFLKTLCQGLKAKGEPRLPRGFQGITDVFDLYLSAVNERLASKLDYDARITLVRKAMEVVSGAILDSGENWLTLEKAAEIVNALLPGRDYERSLYRGLVVEGVLVEEPTRCDGVTAEGIVFVGYERFADHLAAKTLLDRYLDARDPASAFAQDGPLAFICDKHKYVSPGLLEALCIQLPERTEKELISIAPTSAERWGVRDAFRQSLVWRAYAGFSDATRDVLNKLCRNEYDLHDTLDVLLTVSTLPGHPLNAQFLDRCMRKYGMADRDAWWSVYLHHAWGAHGAVDRLVDWTSSLDVNEMIDDEPIDLCAITLTWMLTTSNRFLRDRTTKALVNLLTGRLEAAVRLVEKFADVDDLYVLERVYAVAYGVAMRSHCPVAVGTLAMCIYSHVFATGSATPHILLRDYARGVVERALYLGSAIDVVPEYFRPPYRSTWPSIPTDEDIKQLLPDWSKGSHDSGELEWSRNRIVKSVMDGDFACYVIGTNSSFFSSDWLSFTLDEPPWKLSLRLEDRLCSLVKDFSDDEQKAWERFEAADKAHTLASRPFVSDWFAQWEKNETSGSLDPSDLKALVQELEKASPTEVAKLEERKRDAVAALEDVLTEEHAQHLEEILAAKETDHEARRPPRFDLRQIQRYILKRVFDLGWTVERFGCFDRFSIGYNGHTATKAERIGKKYQWIAYHEIMAFVSDRFQYREQFREEEGDQAYEGPWQDQLRDIDPSCTMKSQRRGPYWDGHAAAWWGSAHYDAWGNQNSQRDWVLNCDDLPKFEELLIVTNPADGSRWLNGQGNFNWKQQTPVDQEWIDVERREIFYIFTGYLVRADDAQYFLKWAYDVDFWGRWMPDAAEVHRMFLGEHEWAPASRYFQKPYYGDEGWTQPNHDCPVKMRTVAFKYLREINGFDCSIDESLSFCLPVSDIVTALGIRWSGCGADFIDAVGRVAVQDPTVHTDGPSALLFREDLLQEFLDRQELTICWTVLGEKRVLSPGFMNGPDHPSLRMSGAYALSEGHAKGFVKQMLDDPQKGRSNALEVINVVRSVL